MPAISRKLDADHLISLPPEPMLAVEDDMFARSWPELRLHLPAVPQTDAPSPRSRSALGSRSCERSRRQAGRPVLRTIESGRNARQGFLPDNLSNAAPPNSYCWRTLPCPACRWRSQRLHPRGAGSALMRLCNIVTTAVMVPSSFSDFLWRTKQEVQPINFREAP